MRYLILAPLISFTIAQDMQVKYVVAYTIDVDWGGEIETCLLYTSDAADE